MGAVVPVCRNCLTIGTEVGVVANSTLEAHTLDVGQIFLVFAERAITVNAVMSHGSVVGLRKRLVDGNEPVAGMDELGVLDALRAEIPVWAVETLVTNTVDEFLASITHGRVANMPAGVAEITGQDVKGRVAGRCLEDMARMMTMFVGCMAIHAQIIVVAVSAGDEFFLRKDLDTAIASPGWFFGLNIDQFALLGESARHLLFNLGFALGTNPLGGAIDYRAILDESLHHPVSWTRTMEAGLDTA
jgi:hypothetical protein